MKKCYNKKSDLCPCIWFVCTNVDHLCVYEGERERERERRERGEKEKEREVNYQTDCKHTASLMCMHMHIQGCNCMV